MDDHTGQRGLCTTRGMMAKLCKSACACGRVCVLFQAASALLVSATAAFGQSEPWRAPSTPQRVEPGIEDVGSRGVGRSSLFVDLRGGVGFSDVYTFRKDSAFGVPRSMFMRRSGAVTAVFPRSAYVETRNGLRPTIPAGTIFHLGDPSRREAYGIDRPRDEEESSVAAAASSGRVLAQREDRRIRMEAPPQTSGPGASSTHFAAAAGERLMSDREREAQAERAKHEPQPKSLWTNEAYRQGRIEQLVALARDGE